MSNIIPPMVSSSPPPMDDTMEEDEDDEFGDFARAEDTGGYKFMIVHYKKELKIICRDIIHCM